MSVVQLPVSLYDQRLLANNTLNNLKRENIEIHARSIYLQGLLLTTSREWPLWICKETREHHQKLEDLARKRDCKLIDLVLGLQVAGGSYRYFSYRNKLH